jgi:hypothetical protein
VRPAAPVQALRRREEIDAAMSGTLEANRKRNGSEGCDASWAIERLVEELESNAPVRTFGPLYRNTLHRDRAKA